MVLGGVIQYYTVYRGGINTSNCTLTSSRVQFAVLYRAKKAYTHSEKTVRKNFLK